MPWFTFSATVDGELEAIDEEEARMIIRAQLGTLGCVDIETLDCEDGFESEDE